VLAPIGGCSWMRSLRDRGPRRVARARNRLPVRNCFSRRRRRAKQIKHHPPSASPAGRVNLNFFCHEGSRHRSPSAKRAWAGSGWRPITRSWGLGPRDFRSNAAKPRAIRCCILRSGSRKLKTGKFVQLPFSGLPDPSLLQAASRRRPAAIVMFRRATIVREGRSGWKRNGGRYRPSRKAREAGRAIAGMFF